MITNKPELIRNIATIAHVDHGKTTLVDGLLRQAGAFASHVQVAERVMDSMDLERERGITIQAKNAAVQYNDCKINIVDTPGHADFGGEVERIMGMVDGALLLVDAAEGPLPQTRFVLSKALKQGLRIILIINKVDRPDARVDEVINSTFDLFMDLGASETQADFPIVYACARQGWCTLKSEEVPALLESKGQGGSLKPLFDTILTTVPAPPADSAGTFQMLVSNLAYSDYLGRLAIGRVTRGTIKKNQRMMRLGENGKTESFNLSALYVYSGPVQVEVPEVGAGDIAVFAGNEDVQIGDTLVQLPAQGEKPEPLPRILVDPPTISMVFSVNTSPLSGKEGEPIQSRKLKERLERETRANVALRMESTDSSEQYRVLGRGELQLAILIEQMRREGYEFMVGKPMVVVKEEGGQKLEPFERAILDLPQAYVGAVTDLFQTRKGQLLEYRTEHEGRVKLEFVIPTRGLIGIRSRYLTETRGEGMFNTQFEGYQPWKGVLLHRMCGALISDRLGDAVEYGLMGLEDRGVLFVKPGVPVYEGMVIGEHNRDNDLNVNPCREKKLTNIRSAHAEVLVNLRGTRDMSLEQCLEWIDEDEWVEITPKSVRIRKKVLESNR
ncbi:MAG TPA: translational GTPase TypA, partial [Oligoflexia bacterium]|nr:translational GTPase TypA [Oligoflexia bacterium]